MSIEHVEPAPFPRVSLTAVEVPADFARVVIAQTQKTGRLFADQLVHWAIQGADCERLHRDRTPGRRRVRK